LRLCRGARRLGPKAKSLAIQTADLELALGTPKLFHTWERALELAPTRLDLHPRYAEALWGYGRWPESLEVWAAWDDARRAVAREQGLSAIPIPILGHGFAKHIGHLALLDIHVKQDLLAAPPRPRPVLVTHPGAIANQCYLDYWRPYVDVLVLGSTAYDAVRPLVELVGLSMHAWPGLDGRPSFYELVGSAVQRQWDAERRGPLLHLTDDHADRGWQKLTELGVPSGSWFVTLHVREGGYQTTRNADPTTYCKAIQAITDRGGWVVRLGDPDTTPLPAMPQVVDYAHSGARRDWMDVFLLAACRFLLGSQSGPFQVPGTFGVPAVQANWHPVPFQYWYRDDLFIPKRYWSRRERRFLTYREVVGGPIGGAGDFRVLDELDVDLVDNTPAEVEAVTLEMLDRLEGDVTHDGADEDLQRAYDSLPFPIPRQAGRPRVGRDFLREHSELVV
jgi:putative glycosyltransferase (TIGR04372 family)